MAPTPIQPLAEVRRILLAEAEAIRSCIERLQRPEQAKNWEQALDVCKKSLEKGGKIVVSGVGKSGKIAQKIAATLSSTGSLAIYLHPTEGLHGDLGVLSPHDTVIALSQTGNTEELLHLMPSIARLGIPVIGIGGNPRSRLASYCAYWIDSAVDQEACPHNLAPTTSSTLQLAIGDAFAVTLMQMRGFNAEAFAMNHPGGAIGKRLTLTVRDIMHTGDAVACLGPDATADEVVEAATLKKLGGVLVVEGKKLIGLITDGDIRRALRHREKFFTFTARQMMTPAPSTITPEKMAAEALELMENRPSQISVLPVVTTQGEWAGLIRLHDLTRIL